MGKQARDYHTRAEQVVFERLEKGISRQILALATGCHAAGTRILMFNGVIKNVEDICVGELLMGDNGAPREVLSLARGNEQMVKITPIKGDEFVVNINHILSLKRTSLPPDRAKRYPEILNIKVADYLNLSAHTKHLYKLYKSGPLSFGKSLFQEINTTKIDPYFIGLWLGDGTVGSTNITKDEPELDEYFSTFSFEGTVSKKYSNSDKCAHHSFTTQGRKENPLRTYLKTLFVNNEKRIPFDYLTNNIDKRYSLLAGLLDTDGYLGEDGCSYEIITKYKGLSDDILFLCRSLGLRANCSDKIGKIKYINFEGLYYRISISGNTHLIPCKIKRKKANLRRQIKNCLVTGFKIELLENDNYYGFELDGNHLYCMGDFTVTHNTGKTFLAAIIAKRFKKILFMSHTEELMEQSGLAMLNEFYPDININETVNAHGGLIEYFRHLDNIGSFATAEEKSRFGIIKADMFNIDAHITLASFQTIHRRLDRIPSEHFDLVIVDECHLSAAKSIKRTLDYLKPKLLLGLSASPYRADGASLDTVFQEISFQYNISDAIQDGYLCELDAIQVRTQLNLDDVRTTAGEFNQKDLRQEVDTPARNKLIVDSYKKYADGKQNLVFCVDVEHAQNLCMAFKEAGYRAEFVVGDTELTPDRRAVIDRFKTGETQVLLNCMILTAGYDNPFIKCLTLACPTKSLTKFIQQLGRATRTLPGVIDGIGSSDERRAAIKQSNKPHCIILDVVDTTARHNVVNTWTLEKDLPIEKKVFLTSEKRIKLLEARTKREFEAKTQKDTRVQLIPLPKIKHGSVIYSKDDATAAQLNTLYGLGFDIENIVYTKGDAYKLIANDAAPKEWVYVLKKKGYDTTRGVTRSEALAIFKVMREKEAKMKEAEDMSGISPVQGL